MWFERNCLKKYSQAHIMLSSENWKPAQFKENSWIQHPAFGRKSWKNKQFGTVVLCKLRCIYPFCQLSILFSGFRVCRGRMASTFPNLVEEDYWWHSVCPLNPHLFPGDSFELCCFLIVQASLNCECRKLVEFCSNCAQLETSQFRWLPHTLFWCTSDYISNHFLPIVMVVWIVQGFFMTISAEGVCDAYSVPWVRKSFHWLNEDKFYL